MLSVAAFDIRNIKTEQDFNRIRACLSKERRQRMDRYLYPADQKRCAVAQLLVEYTLRQVTGKWIDRSLFRRTENGKPVIKGEQNLHFNVSHAGDWVCCAVADVPVGIDIEVIQPVEPGMYKHCLTQEERQYVERGSPIHKKLETPSEEAERFIRIWTMKESYLKMTGEGLFRDLTSFSVISKNGQWCVFKEDDSKRCSGYTEMKPAIFYSKIWKNVYLLSVCGQNE